MVTEIDHTTIINWVEEAGESLPDEPQNDEIPEITEIDELYVERYPLGQTFVGSKKNQFWIWTRAHPRPVPRFARSDAFGIALITKKKGLYFGILAICEA